MRYFYYCIFLKLSPIINKIGIIRFSNISLENDIAENVFKCYFFNFEDNEIANNFSIFYTVLLVFKETKIYKLSLKDFEKSIKFVVAWEVPNNEDKETRILKVKFIPKHSKFYWICQNQENEESFIYHVDFRKKMDTAFENKFDDLVEHFEISEQENSIAYLMTWRSIFKVNLNFSPNVADTILNSKNESSILYSLKNAAKDDTFNLKSIIHMPHEIETFVLDTKRGNIFYANANIIKKYSLEKKTSIDYIFRELKKVYFLQICDHLLVM